MEWFTKSRCPHFSRMGTSRSRCPHLGRTLLKRHHVTEDKDERTSRGWRPWPFTVQRLLTSSTSKHCQDGNQVSAWTLAGQSFGTSSIRVPLERLAHSTAFLQHLLSPQNPRHPPEDSRPLLHLSNLRSLFIPPRKHLLSLSNR